VLSLSVNLSARQLDDPGLIADVRSALTLSGLAPERLTLEITESVVARDVERAAAVFHELKALGLRLALDDFGTGYSSLSALQQFPIDIIKVDRCFVAGLHGDAQKAAVAEAVLTFGRDLELETVAEGIELAEEAHRAHALACEFGQGYLFARPLAADAIEALLSTGTTLVSAVPRPAASST
jgi:EAL domain-containing protein (putative c-di-GMP-specific phosphodiesterase class I)